MFGTASSFIVVANRSQVLMQGMNHSIYLLTGNGLQDFIAKVPLLQQRGKAAVEETKLDPLADRRILTMVTLSKKKDTFLFGSTKTYVSKYSQG